MEFVRTSDLWDNSYFLSNTSCFFYRFADSGFKNKWTGLWHKENKFLEHFAFRDHGEWLSEEKVKRFRYDGASAIHDFRLPGRTIKQTVYLPETSYLIIELKGSKPMDLDLEIAFNIRRRYENRTVRQYESRSHPSSVMAWNSIGSLSVHNVTGKLGFDNSPEYREHSSSDEPQNYFIPGRIKASGKELTLVLTPSFSDSPTRPLRDHRGALKRRKQAIRDFRRIIKSDSKLLEKGFIWSAISTDFCRKVGSGIVSWYAGLPWFQQFWGRDLFWVVPSLMILGHHENVKRSLEYFSMVAENGRVPNQFSETEGRDMNALDPTLLWVAGLEEYVTQTGDLGFLEKISPKLHDIMRYILSRDSDGDGYLEHDRESPETWMDTLKRDSNAVEIQALACSALESGERLLSRMKCDEALLDQAREKHTLIRRGLERDFFHDGFFADRFFWKQKVPTRTANSLVPLLLGFRKHSKEILKVIESERFTNPVGIRTRAEGEPGYDPRGYHTGQTWSLTTAWASAAEFASGRKERGWRYLRMLLDDMEKDSLGCVGESWDSSSLGLTGCSLQLWGSGFIPRLVDESMLGIRINSLDRTIHADPQLPRGIASVDRVRQTGLGPVKIRFRKSHGRTSVSCSNRKFRLVQ